MHQMMFYAMTEAEMFDPAITVRSLTDIQSKGFDSIYLEFRNTLAPRQSPRFLETVARLCRDASRLGLAVVMDSSLNAQSAAMLTYHPEVFTDSLSSRRITVSDGRFMLEFSHSDPSTRVLENAWRLVREGDACHAEEVAGN